MKQANKTGSVNRPLAWPVPEILVDSAMCELGMESGHLLLNFAGLPDTYKKMVDTAAAWVRNFHGLLGWGYSLDVRLAVSSLKKTPYACPEEIL